MQGSQPDSLTRIYRGNDGGALYLRELDVDVPKGVSLLSGSFGAALIGQKRELVLEQTGTDRTRRLSPEYALDWNRFASGISGALGGRVVGYAFAIAKNGGILRSGAGGLRRRAVDGGTRSFTTRTQAQTASAAKTINATAIMKALYARGLTVEAKVAPFLPLCWERGTGVANLTFRQLLNHTSRLPRVNCNGGDGYKCLVKMIAEGRT